MVGTDPARSAGKIRAPPFIVFKSAISRFDERFRDGQYSLVSLLFAGGEGALKSRDLISRDLFQCSSRCSLQVYV